MQGNVFDEHLYLLLISFLHTSNHWLEAEASLPHILPLRPPPLQLLASPSPSAAPLWFSKKLSINSPKVWCDNRRKSSVRRKELGSWRRQFRGKTKVARHHCLCCRRIFRSNRKLIYSYWGMKLCKVSKRKCARILLPGFSSHPRSLPKKSVSTFPICGRDAILRESNLKFWITWMSLAQKVGCTDLWPASFWKRVFTMKQGEVKFHLCTYKFPNRGRACLQAPTAPSSASGNFHRQCGFLK